MNRILLGQFTISLDIDIEYCEKKKIVFLFPCTIMKTRTKLSIIVPIVLLAILLTANFSTIFAQTSDTSDTMTPIKHVVVIFQENVSFDHYFATYPNATNPPNEPQFNAAPRTPTANGLTGSMLTNNPNELVTGNTSDNPARLDRTEPVTCDNDHGYSAEQAAFNGGLMNMFPEQTSCSDGLVMDYYDGNTVTALWNYAQNYALSDNSFGTTFGPSTPGALNVVSGIGGPLQFTLALKGHQMRRTRWITQIRRITQAVGTTYLRMGLS